MAVFVGVRSRVRAIGPALPPLSLDLIVGLGTAYAAAWLTLVVVTLVEIRLGRDDARQRWQRRNRWITWGGSADSILAYWLAAPYAALDLQLVFALFYIGIVTINVVASIDRPRGRGAGRYLPLVLPAAIAAFYATHWNPYSPALIVRREPRLVAQALRRLADGRRPPQAPPDAEAALVEVAPSATPRPASASASHDWASRCRPRGCSSTGKEGRTPAQVRRRRRSPGLRRHRTASGCDAPPSAASPAPSPDGRSR